MERVLQEMEKELHEAKRECGLLNFKKRNSMTESDKWYYIGAMKQTRKRIDTLLYLISILEDEIEKTAN